MRDSRGGLLCRPVRNVAQRNTGRNPRIARSAFVWPGVWVEKQAAQTKNTKALHTYINNASTCAKFVILVV